MIKTYNFFLKLLWPIILIYICYRKKIGKENLERFNERIGIYKKSRPKGQLIWFHAASVGESISIISLVEDLVIDYNILVTSGTVTSADILSQRLPKQAIHQFIPIDRKIYVYNFLNHFKPDLAIFVESEIWPNLISSCKERDIKLILASARITPKSQQRIKIQQFFFKETVNLFDKIIPQDSYTQSFYQKIINNDKLAEISNLKSGDNPLPYKRNDLLEIKQKFKDRVLFLAASTHEGEEALIAECHKEVRQKYPNLLTIIIPRHIRRAKKIESYLHQEMFSTSIRSRNDDIYERTDIYIADTIGEMGLFFELVDFAFIGGSLVNKGGHNILEPARSNTAIITGKYTQNFTDNINLFKESNALTEVRNIGELEQIIDKFLTDKELLNSQIKNAKKIISKFSKIRPNYIKLIKGYL